VRIRVMDNKEKLDQLKQVSNIKTVKKRAKEGKRDI